MRHTALLLVVAFSIISSNSYAQNSPQAVAFGNDWVATDALGRTLPTYQQIGPMKPDRYVGMFYFFWQWHVSRIRDVTKILAANPTNPTWENTKTYYWGEPSAGYYCSNDPWVIRRNVMMLADAGVDFVFLDYTNNYSWAEYDTTLETYCKISEQLKSQGIDVPRIVFFFNTDPAAYVDSVYNNFYKPDKYSDLWFYWEGKPLILADSAATVGGSTATAGMQFTTDSSFTGIDVNCPSYANNIGDLTLKLYKWTGDYATTIAGTPIADSTFVNFPDNAFLRLNFPQQPAGEYYWQLGNATEMVGVWEYNSTNDSVTSYFSGQTVPGANYMSRVYYTPNSAPTPLILASGTPVAVQIPSGLSGTEAGEIANFFTWRQMWDYTGAPNEWWKYTDTYPQTPYYHDGKLEQICVCKAVGAPVWPVGGVNNRGASFYNGQAPAYNEYWVSKYTPYGLNFQAQWDQALQVDPPIVTVTGWNEWIAGAWSAVYRDPTQMLGKFYFMGNLLTQTNPYYFVDEFNEEFNRDIEPMKGGYGADYYYQLVSNIRRYKGMNPPVPASPPETITMNGDFNEWSSVVPVFRNAAGGTIHRDFRNVDDSSIYVNNTGRNDIVESRVAYDSNNVYFYVKTDSALTPYTGKNWMLLFIDADTNHTTGWEGYDYVIDLNVKSDSVTTLSAWDGQDSSWNVVADLNYRYVGNQMEIEVPRDLIGQAGKNIAFYFHWADNIQNLSDVTNFYGDGDTAPGGRFNYLFTTEEPTYVNETRQQPVSFSLSQNYPNPFNPTTTIVYHVPRRSFVTLKVYNLLGERVTTLVDREESAGKYTAEFNASRLASGVYLYRIEAGGFSSVKKMMLVK